MKTTSIIYGLIFLLMLVFYLGYEDGRNDKNTKKKIELVENVK